MEEKEVIEQEYPTGAGGSVWVRKMRALFKRLDANGHGYLMIDDVLEVAAYIINVFPKMVSYKYDYMVNTLVHLWYQVFCTHVPRSTATTTNLNEPKFVDNILTGLKGHFREKFNANFISPMFDAMDQDDDGKITLPEFTTLMIGWKSVKKECEIMFRTHANGPTMTKESFLTLFADFFMSDDIKSKSVKLWGPLVNYKRPEDYGTLDCGPVWEGKMRTMFRRLDVNQSSKLRCHDLLQIGQFLVQRAHLDVRRGGAVLRSMLNIWVKFLTVDKDGSHLDEISESSFIHNMREMINGEYRHEIDQFGWTFFKVLETEGSGFITQNSYKTLQEAWHVGREEGEGMFKQLDSDKDGKINSDEFMTAWNEFFLSEDPHSPYRMFFGPVISKPTIL